MPHVPTAADRLLTRDAISELDRNSALHDQDPQGRDPIRKVEIPVTGTEAVVLHYNEKPMHWFKYAVGGEVIVDFHTLQAIEPTGQDPARLDDAMRPLGLIPGQVAPLHSVLALAENAFDIRLRQPDDSRSKTDDHR
nr:DUF6461 domain-containing protein [Streptomyces sp. NWU339]